MPAAPDRLLSPPRRGGRRAFTIVEVMVAAGVMALVLTTSITTLQSAFMALDAARNVTSAGQIMQSELEKMRLKDWSVISGYEAGEARADDEFDERKGAGSRVTSDV